MPALAKFFETTAFRWLAAYLALFLILAAGFAGYIFSLTSGVLTAQLRQTIDAEVTGLKEQFATGGLPLLQRTIEERSRGPGDSLYLLADPSGSRVAGNLDRLPPSIADEPSGGLFLYRLGGAGERHAAGVAIPVPGGYRLVVGRDVETTREFALTVRRVLLWGLGLIALAGLGGGLLASRGILRRIDAITATSQSIMNGDLSRRIPVQGSGDELDKLARGLNSMLERIEQLMAGLKEVSDNIAHDLKTPLTRLRTHAESALRTGGDTGAYRGALEASIEEADEIIKTFNALLSIARLEAGAEASLRAAVDLSAIARDTVELYQPVAEEAGMALVLDAAAPALVAGDRQLLGQAIANLIDNALKYARPTVALPGRGRVDITVATKGSEVLVVVADQGPGIAETDRGRVLRRFVRLEASRSMAGSGLGLSLVAAVARNHGGDLRLEDNAPGLRAVIALPRAAAQYGGATDAKASR